MTKTDARRRSFLSFAIRLGLVLIVVIAAVYWLLLADLQRTLKYRLDRLYDRGFPRTWQQVIPPPVPDDQNAAILYEQAFDRLTPTASDPEFRVYHNKPPASSLDPHRKLVERTLASNQAALELLWQAAEKRCCRFLIDWPSTAFEFETSTQLFEPLRHMRTGARLLVADALIAAQNGDTKRAARSVRSGIRLSAHTLSESTTIGLLVGIATEAITLKSLPGVLSEVEFDRKTCRRLYDELGRLDLDTSFRKAVTVEGLETLARFDVAERTPAKLRGFAGSDDGWFPRDAIRWRLLLSPLGKPWRLKEEIIAIGWIEEVLDSVDKPLYEGARACHEAEENDRGLGDDYILAFPFARMAMARYRAIGYRNAAQVMLALEAYHTTRGAYPDSLAGLRTYPGWKLPIDPYSGKDFQYRRDEKGYILYSYGEDFDDDGGRPARSFGLDGDWVWTVER